jgi:Fur family zinc uptake transcriptional regulator
MSLDDFLDKIAIRRNFVLTPLRRAILTIMFNHRGCMKAYDIVTQLNNIRADTKPIIVYRVLNFLVVNKVLHKISSKNIFMLCADFCSV